MWFLLLKPVFQISRWFCLFHSCCPHSYLIQEIVQHPWCWTPLPVLICFTMLVVSIIFLFLIMLNTFSWSAQNNTRLFANVESMALCAITVLKNLLQLFILLHFVTGPQADLNLEVEFSVLLESSILWTSGGLQSLKDIFFILQNRIRKFV